MDMWVRGMTTAEVVIRALQWKSLAETEYWRPGMNERGHFVRQVANARRSGRATLQSGSKHKIEDSRHPRAVSKITTVSTLPPGK